jgi:hypothetical protein
MHTTHPVDSLLLLAVALSSKRRPAELVEIIAAVDLAEGAQGIVPSALIICDALHRLAKHGFVSTSDGLFALTPAALQIMAALPRKAATPERLSSIQAALASATAPAAECPTLQLTTNQVSSAIVAHRASGKNVGKNLLVPKPNTSDAPPKPGQRQRKPFSARRRKD